MTHVHVWLAGTPGGTQWFHMVSGHIAIAADDSYFSFWPPRKIGNKHNVGLLCPCEADFSRTTIESDIEGMEHEPDESVVIDGLDEVAIRRAWVNVRRCATAYELMRVNCCTVSSRLLNAGIPVRFRWPDALDSKRDVQLRRLILGTRTEELDPNLGLPVMTPSVVLFFALLLKNRIEDHGWSEDDVLNDVRAIQRRTGQNYSFMQGLFGLLRRLR